MDDILDYELIVKGEIIDTRIVNGEFDWDDELQATFVIKKNFYPKTTPDTININTSIGGLACGLNFEIGDTWLIFANKTEDKYSASLCSKSIRLTTKRFFRYYYRIKYVAKYSKKTRYIKDKVDNYLYTGQLINGLPDGLWIKTKKSDTLDLMPFSNGLKNGLWIRRFEIGESRIEQHFENGKRNGLFKQYNKDNILVYYIDYSNDKMNGIYKDFNDNGELFEKGQYSEGKPIGKWDRYINGKLYYSFYFNDNGEKTGKWEKYDENGQLIEKHE